MRRLIVPLALLVAVAVSLLRPGAFDFAGTSPAYDAGMAAAATAPDRGIVTFAFGDWDALTSDTLRTSAAPWKLTTAAMALQSAQGDVAAAAAVDVNALFRLFGFHSPDSFANWPASLPAPDIATPVGQNVALAQSRWPPLAATIGNIGCAACHSSVVYGADGAPDPGRVWLGTPNGSINLEAYTQTLFTAVRDFGNDTDRLFEVMQTMYPDTGLTERLTLRYAVLPALRSEVAARDSEYGRLLPFRASLAGATNGLDSLRNRLGLIAPGTVLTESIFNSVPDLGGRLWRTKLLNSGTYAIPGIDHGVPVRAGDITPEHRRGLAGIIAYFTVPSMGVSVEVAESNIDDGMDITAWMAEYTAQPWPGEIDAGLAATGRDLYATGCAACHGTYDDSPTDPQLTSFPNWEGDIGTDPQRARLLTPQIAQTVNDSLFGQYINARTVATYTAPPLEGLWSSAPYFHNGSVPTLWHLMHPDERPATFDVGGHRLDLERVGIDLDPPRDYVPWSIPARVDTGAFGLSSGGHEEDFADMPEAHKTALLEYLKLL